MGKCLGCKKKLGFFEGYEDFDGQYCKACYPKRKEILKRENKVLIERKKEEQKEEEKGLMEEQKEKEKKRRNRKKRGYGFGDWIIFFFLLILAMGFGVNDFVSGGVWTLFTVLLWGAVIYEIFYISSVKGTTFYVVVFFSGLFIWSSFSWIPFFLWLFVGFALVHWYSVGWGRE